MRFQKKYFTPPIIVYFFFLFLFSFLNVSAQVLGTYNCSGSTQTYVVPAGLCQVKIKAWGAAGAGGGIDTYGGGAGGGGTYADVTINVAAGDILTVYVGCKGIRGTGCGTAPGGPGGFGYGNGGNGGAAGPQPCSGSGGGGGGSSCVLLNGVPMIVAAGGGGGGGGGCKSAGGDGGPGGINGSSTSFANGGTAAGNGSPSGGVGQTHPADGGGGGGGGGGYSNGGQGGFAPPFGSSCAPTDCGAGGGGGGNSFAPSGTITNGSGPTPGNSGDPDLCASCAQGGGSMTDGNDGFVELLVGVAPVVATVSSNSPICQGLTLNLNSTGGGTYAWAGPNSFSSIQQNPSLPNAMPAMSGTYSVLVTNTSGCSTTLSVNVVVNPLPVANAGNNLTICNGDVATLNASGGTNYLWTPSTSLSNPNIFNPTANPASTISYTVVVTDANGCTDDASMSITVNPLPIPAISGNNTICFGFSTTLTASGGVAYLWNTNAITASISVSPPATTTYTVMVISANSCTAIATMPVTVNPLPVPQFTAPPVCFNNATVFTDQSTTASGSITNWNWNFGDGNTSAVQSPSHTYNASGTFTVTLIVTNSFGCMDSLKQSIIVNPIPATNFSATTVCIGNPTCFTDLTTISSGTISAWSWNFNDPNSGPTNISNVQNPCHTYTMAGTYNVILTATSNNNCQTTVILAVTVFPNPVAAFSAPNVCLNALMNFTDASTGAVQWNWDFGDGGKSTLQNPPHTYIGNGTYLVTLIATSSGNCTDTVTHTVTVYALPIVIFKSDSVCMGKTTSFTDLSLISSGTISSWSWNFGDAASGANNTSSLQNPTHVFTAAGTFNVTLSVTSNNGCVSSVVLSAIVHPLPVAAFNSKPGPAVSLTDNVAFIDLSTYSPVQWFWDFGDSSTSAIQYPSHVYSDTGTYMVTLIVISQFGCVDTVQHPIEVKDFTFYIPNAFTPNRDGVNDFFFGTGIGIKEYEMWIFDRWGNLIFHCSINGLPQTLPCMWDGVVRGGSSNEKIQEDVYIWKVHLTNVFDKTFDYLGTVTVVK